MTVERRFICVYDVLRLGYVRLGTYCILVEQLNSCVCVQFGGDLMKDGVSSVKKMTESVCVWSIMVWMSIRLRV